MRCILIIFLFWSASGLAQNINVVREYSIADEIQTPFFYPEFNPDNSKIFFTQHNYKGIWYFDLRARNLVQVNDHDGAGYEPVFLAGGNDIIFRTFRFDGPRKKYSLHVQNINTKTETVLERDIRNLSAPLAFGDKIVYRHNENLKLLTGSFKTEPLNVVSSENPLVYSADKKIICVTTSGKKVLQPLGPVWYLWLSLAPDKSRILFTVAGQGSFITDLDGNILTTIQPELHAPQWSPDGQWILYMNDEDDGHVIISSDLFVFNLQSQSRIALTNSPDRLEMYPQWSNSGKRIVFNTYDGKIFLLDVETY